LGQGVQQFAVALSDLGSFRAFYEEALPRVYSYLLHRCGGNPQLAEDLTQETFMAAVKEIQKQGGVAAPIPWILGVARHKLMDHYRAREREERKIKSMQRSREDEYMVWEGEESRQRALAALDGVPGPQRAALVLLYLDGLSVPEVARVLDRSIHATESLLARGKVSFKRAYLEADHA